MIVLAISCFLIIITPLITMQFRANYETSLFFREFENHFKVVQMAAITTGQPSSVHFNAEENTIEFSALGEPSLNKKMVIPVQLQLQDSLFMTLKEYSGAANKFKNITFKAPQGMFVYHFQMGGAKFYVEQLSP